MPVLRSTSPVMAIWMPQAGLEPARAGHLGLVSRPLFCGCFVPAYVPHGRGMLITHVFADASRRERLHRQDSNLLLRLIPSFRSALPLLSLCILPAATGHGGRVDDHDLLTPSCCSSPVALGAVRSENLNA